MSDGFSIDYRDLERSLNLYQEVSGKDEVEVVNHAARNIAFRAASYTPKAKSAKITGYLNKKISYTDSCTGRSHETWLKYPLINFLLRTYSGAPAVFGEQMAQEADGFMRRKLASAGYGRAGWIPAILQLGGSYRGARLRPGGLAAQGYARKADIHELVAEIGNAARGVGAFGEPALRAAVAYVALDMRRYAEKKLAKRAKQFSA